MKKLIFSLIFILSAPLAWSQPITVGTLSITQLWARPAPINGGNGAAYLSITNNGQQPDRLVSVSGEIAKQVQLHRMSMENNIMRMREIEGGIELPAGQTVRLSAGGMHIMMLGLRHPLKAGEHFALTLHFEHAGDVEVKVKVQNQPSEDGMDMQNMKMN